MKEKACLYDWAAYYQAAYEKERKKNMVLAGKVADAEAKEADLIFHINHIQNNIFWKLSVPVRKCYHALFRRDALSETEEGAASDDPATTTDRAAMEACIRAYQEEVYRQKHPYLQWIQQYEGEESNDIGNKDIENKDIENKDIENTDVKSNDIKNDNTCNENTETGRIIDGWQVMTWEDMDLCIILCGYGIADDKIEEKIKSWFNKNQDCLLAYTDEDYYWKNLSDRMHPWYKPCYSPDTLLSFCYMGHMIITKQSLYNEISMQGYNKGASYADFYDLCLRLEEEAYRRHGSISHIEEVLFHNCYEPDASGQEQLMEAERLGMDVLEAVEKLLQKELEQGRDMTGCGASFCSVREAALRRRGLRAHLEPGPVPDIYHVVYELPESSEGAGTVKEGMVSVIIPSKDHPEVLERCLFSFREKTDYDNYEWIVVDNGSNPENRRHMEDLREEYGFLYLYEPMEFNFSAMCNLGAAKAQGDYLLLLNDDVEIVQKDWLRIMAGQAGRPHTGAVGAKLWYAGSESIQHTGITNLDIGPSHKLITFPDDRSYYYGRNQVTYNMVGVTAACLMIERRKYWEAGGMDESMKVSYNDVDFCFKLAEAGYYNVLCNDAVLYHYESLSRGLDEQDDGKWERLLREKENLYAKHPAMQGYDAFYHKNLIDNASHYACNFKFDYNNSLKTTELIVENEGNLADAKSGVLQLTVDRAEKQHKIHREEPDIMYIMGWGYIPGEDNAKYERKLVLQHEEGALYCAVPCPWFRRDVEAVLSGEVNISLSGFVLRMKKEKLHAGLWRVGMLATDSGTKERFLTWSDRQMAVD